MTICYCGHESQRHSSGGFCQECDGELDQPCRCLGFAPKEFARTVLQAKITALEQRNRELRQAIREAREDHPNCVDDALGGTGKFPDERCETCKILDAALNSTGERKG